MSIPCILPGLFISRIVLRPHVNRRLTYPPSLDSSSIVRTVCYCILLYFLSHFFLSLFSHSFSIFFLWFFFFFFFPYFTFTISLVFFSLSSFGLIMFCSIDIFSRLASAPLSRASTMSYLTFVSPIIFGFLLSLFSAPLFRVPTMSDPLRPHCARRLQCLFSPASAPLSGVSKASPASGAWSNFGDLGERGYALGSTPWAWRRKNAIFGCKKTGKTSLTEFRH